MSLGDAATAAFGLLALRWKPRRFTLIVNAVFFLYLALETVTALLLGGLMIRDRYVCERRGVVAVKGKGEMETYLLVARREGAATPA